MKQTLPILFLLALLVACEDGVLNIPEEPPAIVRIVNTTADVQLLNVVIDQDINASAIRGLITNKVSVPAGRPVGFVLKDSSTDLRRDTLFYTLGGNGNVILFARGAKAGLVEFRRAIHDTTLDANSDPVIRFTHMAEDVNQFATLEVWLTGGTRLFPEDYDPGISTAAYKSLPPGTYSFEVREYGTTTVGATIQNVILERGKSYMLYTWNADPLQTDNIALSIFD